jgi:pimeloyl-ACP methyl ester carboxylesterase
MESVKQKRKRIMLLVLSIFLICPLLFLGLLLSFSSGKPQPFLNKNGTPLAGSISEKTRVQINGVEQGMFIKGKDIKKPVLLYLHGGLPDYFLTDRYPTGLEDFFIVCWWEQRGSGLSYNADIKKETITLEQILDDTKEVTNYLCKRFGQEKIYLMGHSGGTFIGIQAAQRTPELYFAYMGVAQMSDQLKSEQLAYEHMLDQFKKNGSTRMVHKLEKAPVSLNGVSKNYLSIRDQAMHSLGIGTMHDMKSVISGIFLESLRKRDYTLGEKFNMWRGKALSGVSVLWKNMIETDLAKQVPELKIPVYFFHGIHDYTCSYSEAKKYFEKLQAPMKGFYTFEQSAHSPIFEEPEKMQHILQNDVLVGVNKLADRK